MKKSEYILKSLPHAFGVLAYTTGVAWLLFNAGNIFGNKPDNFLAPLLMLLLFVVSAATTGLLVLGKPIHLYLSGLKKEAFIFLFATLLWLIFFVLIVAITIALR